MSNFLKNRRIFTTKFDLESSGGGISLVTSDDKVKSLIQGTNITIVDNGNGTVTISTNADDIVVVANYSALPSPASVAGNFYWVSASQGTSWLPGSLGGTYYPKGVYYSNGVSWEYIETPYQATQAEVNTGTDTNKFVTPATLSNSIQLNSKVDKTPRLTSVTTSATPTPNADTTDLYTITALAEGAVFGAPTGTPVAGQALLIRIKDNGTARSLGFNAAYRFSSDLPKPTTTIISKTFYMAFVYNAVDTKWDNIGQINNF